MTPRTEQRISTYFVIGECKELLAQSVFMLLVPLVGQELLNLVTALDKLVAVTPDGIGSVGHLDL